MQNRLWLGALLVGLPAACMVGALGVGCGGSSDDSAAGTDSGSDVTVQQDTGAADTGSPVDAGRCDDADIGNLSLPDAALGDSGASVGTCLSCTKASCSSQINSCNKSCQCKNDIDDALGCIAAQGGLNATCIGGLAGGGDKPAQDLGTCLYTACKNECGLGGFNLPDAGGDAGDGG